MKKFDDEDRCIISKINDGEGFSRNLINLIDINLEGVRIQIDKTNKTAQFLFQTNSAKPTDIESNWGIEQSRKLNESLIKYLVLFRYLEREELATFFNPAKDNEATIEFGRGAVNMPHFSMRIEDQTIIELLINYVNKEIIPSPDLRQLEINGFKSDEQIRFEKQQLATWAALIVSILIGLYGVFSNISNNKSQDKQFKQGLKQNEKIADQLISEIKTASNNIPDYTKNLDAIKTGIVDLTSTIEDNKETVKTKPDKPLIKKENITNKSTRTENTSVQN